MAPANRRGAAARTHWVALTASLVVLVLMLTVVGLLQHRTGAAGTAPGSAATTALPAGAGPVFLATSADPSTTTTKAPAAGLVALTFDDGPDPVWTPQILRILRENHVHATFFVVGAHAALYPGLVRQIVAEGHEIGIHTFTHLDLATASASRIETELSLTQNVVAAATGRQTHLLRPPYSSTADAVTAAQWPSLRVATAQGYAIVLSTVDTRDWATPGVARIVASGTPPAGEGALVLMHDGGGDRAQTVAALPTLIQDLRARGDRLTTVSQAVGVGGAELSATTGQRVAGTALVAVVLASVWVLRLLTVLLLVFLVLGVLRALLLLVFARRHVRQRRAVGGAEPWNPPVSVVIPAYQEVAGIAGTVRSLVATGYPGLEIVVVDDGSTDGTADAVERLGLDGVLVVRQANSGKPAALNAGIRAARHDVLVLVDADTVFEPDAVRLLVAPLADPEVGAVSGNTKVSNRTGLLGRWQHLEYVVGFNLDRRMFDVLDCIPTVPGAIGAFRRSALVDVGGVGDDTLAEDTDLTMAVTRAGWRVAYEQSAIAWTEAPSTLRQLWKQRYRWAYGTMQSMWKHRHAAVEAGRAGHLGRRGLPYLFLFQVLMPLLGPVVDIMAIYGLVFLDARVVLGVALAFTLVQMSLGAYALHLDHEPLRSVWWMPLQQLVYRQLMYLVVIQSVASAFAGARVGWQPLQRHGSARVLPGR
ncbi:MAG: bifunctional polysaccharide deacetylase/glycosyltransferase family 2 protein [Actinomycetales bacterium]|nr:bifunctional polysaccharide deacetylase/glycosyltransferase family 2 protein [Actinomycetales bacterium]